MKEVEWLTATDPDKLLWFISGHPEAAKLWVLRGRPSDRKWRLLGVGCCRRIWPHITETDCRRVVDVVESFADGGVPEAELKAVAAMAVDCGYRVHHDRCLHRAYAATDALGRGVGMDATLEHSCSVAVGHAAWAVGDERANEMRTQSVLARCVFGNPFRPVAFSPEWRTSTTTAIAQEMYESRDFSAMPILADALQDAGCDSDDVLNHCRDANQVHVRGCWVVDFVLGNE